MENAFRLARKIECKIMATRKPTTHIYKDGTVATARIPQPTRLTHNNWKKKEKNGFSTVVIENTLKVISVLRRNYFTQIVKRKRKNKMNKIMCTTQINQHYLLFFLDIFFYL